MNMVSSSFATSSRFCPFNNRTMEGISYLTDEAGRKKAIVVDLEKYSEYLEDLLDIIAYEESKDEPVSDFEETVDKILEERKANGEVSG